MQSTLCEIFARLVCSTLLLASASAEQPYEAWTQIYTQSVKDGQRGLATVMDSRGNVFITGFAVLTENGNKKFYTAKYDSLDGHLIWERVSAGAGGNDIAHALVIDSNGDVIVTGESPNLSSGHDTDYLTEKYDGTTGAVVWSNRFAGSQQGADIGLKVAVDSLDNVIVTGSSVGTGTQEDFFTIKYTGSNGGFFWPGLTEHGVRYSAAGHSVDLPAGLAVDSGDNIIVTGQSIESLGGLAGFYTAKYSSAGAVIWQKTYATVSYSEAVGVAVDSANNVVVTGIARFSGSTRAFHTIEYNSAGTFQWSADYQSPGADATGGPVGVVMDSAGNPIVTGTEIDSDNVGTRHYYTVKYRGPTLIPAGGTRVIWEHLSPSEIFIYQNVSAAASDTASSVTVDAADSVIVTGTSSKSAQDSDYRTIKYASDGSYLSSVRFDGQKDDIANAVAVDKNGNVAVTGVSSLPYVDPVGNVTTGIYRDKIVTIKYDRLIVATNDLVPTTTGIAAGAKYGILSTPAIANAGTGAIAARVGVVAGKTKLSAILAEGGAGGASLPAVQGNFAPDSAGTASLGKFLSFSDPVISSTGYIAFAAKLSGVPAAMASAVFAADSSNTLRRVLQTGVAVPGLTTGMTYAPILKAVSSYSWTGGELTALMTVKGVGVTAKNSTILYGYNFFFGGKAILATGDAITVGALPATTIKTISALAPALGSGGQGRSSSGLTALAKLTLMDKRVVLVSAVRSANSINSTALLYTAQDASSVHSMGLWNTFGLPAVGSGGTQFVAMGTLKDTPTTTKLMDSALVYSSNGTTFAPFAIESDSAPGTMGNYLSFFDPVVNSNGDVAFMATLKGMGITAKTKTAIWFGQPNSASLEVVAQLGSTAPDQSGGTPVTPVNVKPPVFAGLTSYALPGGLNAGPIFQAKISGTGVTAKNNVGIWGVDSNGVVRQLLRTGDSLGTLVVSAFNVLMPMPTVFDATRSFNSTGSVGVLVTFTNKTHAIIQIGIP